jgi:hypothetical protein
MKLPSRLRPVLLLLLLALLPAAPVRAQDADEAEFRMGTEAFRFILNRAGFKPLSSWNELGENPGRSLLVLDGYPRDRWHRSLLRRIPGGLRRFLERGGAVLIATDSTLDSRALIEVCGYAVSGERVMGRSPWGETRLQETDLYHRLSEFLIVKPLGQDGPPLFSASLPGRGQQSISLATYLPSYLVHQDDPAVEAKVSVLARLPGVCWGKGGGGFAPGPRVPAPFAVSCELGEGRLLLLADPDAFSNLMMRPLDTDNVEFVNNAVYWLKGGLDGKRDRILFVEDGAINTQIKVRLRARTMSLAEVQALLIEQGDHILQQIEDEAARDDTINKATLAALNEGPGRDLFGRFSADNVHLLLVLLAGLGLAVYGLSRLRRASHKIDPQTPLFAAAAARQAPSASVLQQRQRSALQDDNLGDYAHLLAREWLEAVPEWRPALERGAASEPPAVTFRGGWWQQRSLRKLLREVWRLAQGQTPERMTRWEFRRLLAKLDRLRLALDLGYLSL